MTTYYELSDSNGQAWYLYITSTGDPALTTTEPSGTSAGEWSDEYYKSHLPDLTVNTAGSGIKYLEVENDGGTTIYIYPNTVGDILISDTEPT